VLNKVLQHEKLLGSGGIAPYWWQALVNRVMDIQAHKMAENFVTSCVNEVYVHSKYILCHFAHLSVIDMRSLQEHICCTKDISTTDTSEYRVRQFFLSVSFYIHHIAKHYD
jgi:hypothetical protein